ncbi:hypothetical protein BDV96DRAFT_2619 [Lophiotrema nucula]|uniref:Uncharacterized protein n=1 Tax=Lophiotrema nucula TaxID=690887 RepID=A0A6A5ZW45_9PLEO|nr:hypothetical protein BDV96DRAFT_2619 [Lophiotrema nucula]
MARAHRCIRSRLELSCARFYCTMLLHACLLRLGPLRYLCFYRSTYTSCSVLDTPHAALGLLILMIWQKAIIIDFRWSSVYKAILRTIYQRTGQGSGYGTLTATSVCRNPITPWIILPFDPQGSTLAHELAASALVASMLRTLKLCLSFKSTLKSLNTPFKSYCIESALDYLAQTAAICLLTFTCSETLMTNAIALTAVREHSLLSFLVLRPRAFLYIPLPLRIMIRFVSFTSFPIKDASAHTAVLLIQNFHCVLSNIKDAAAHTAAQLLILNAFDSEGRQSEAGFRRLVTVVAGTYQAPNPPPEPRPLQPLPTPTHKPRQPLTDPSDHCPSRSSPLAVGLIYNLIDKVAALNTLPKPKPRLLSTSGHTSTRRIKLPGSPPDPRPLQPVPTPIHKPGAYAIWPEHRPTLRPLQPTSAPICTRGIGISSNLVLVALPGLQLTKPR